MKNFQWEGALPPKEVLKQYQILDTPAEEEFDQITRLAAYICESPISLITVLDGDRQFFKSHYGLNFDQTPIEHSFCMHSLKDPSEPLIITDARVDERFKENPLVISPPHVVFYAGLPLVDRNGVALGSLCVLDTQRRELSSDQLDALSILARQVVQVLELRKKGLIHEVVQYKLMEEREFNTDLIENIDGIFWIADPETLEFRYISPQVERIMGYSPAEWKSDPHFWENHIHPADRERIVRSCSLAVRNLEDHQFDYQFLTKSGKYIWINDRVIVHSKDGKPVKLTGLFIDITTEMKLSQEITERNEHYELINQATRDAIYDWDILKDELKFGQSFEKNYGYPLTPEKSVPLSEWESWVHPEDRDRTNLALDGFLKDSAQYKWEREYRMRRADGTYAYVEEIGLVVRSESGKAVRMAGVIRDISDYRKKNRLQSSLTQVIQLLLSHRDWERNLSKILQLVKESAGFREIKYFHLDPEESPVSETRLIKEYSSEKGGPLLMAGMGVNIGKLVQKYKKKKWLRAEEVFDLNDSFNSHPINIPNSQWYSVRIGKEWFGLLAVSFLIPYTEENQVDEVDFLANFSLSLASAVKRKADHDRLEAFSKEKEGILESIGDGFFALDKNWMVRYWNKEAERMIGVSREDIIGKNVWESFPEIRELQFFRRFNEAMESQKIVQFEEFNPWEKRWYESFAYPTPVGLSVFFRDITEQKLIDERIESSNLRFRKVAEASNDAIWDWDLAKDMLFLGEGFKEAFGYEEEIWSTSFNDWMRHIHPKDYKRVVNSFRASVGNPAVSKWSDEYRFRTKGGAYRFVTNRAAILRNSAEEVVRIIGAITDITGRKEYEQKLKGLNQTLRDYVKKLSESNQELEQFAYVASHDLQEPLRMISSFMGLLEKRYGNELDDKAKSYINYAIDGAVRMKKIILDLLEFSRVGKEEQLKEEFEFSEVVEEVILLNKRLIQAKKAEIKIAGKGALFTSRSQLVQILHNLLGNALKYVEKGKQPQIAIRINEKKTHWEVRVSDNGIGIKEEDQDRIFVIFQRLHTQSEIAGTGMGLAIVKKVVANLGGKIWLKSKVGIGTKVYFTFPKESHRP